MRIKEKIELWMRGVEEPPAAAHLALAALSRAYGAVVRMRNLLYGAGVLGRKRLPRPVISVGNLTVGGTGKTPMAMHIAGFILAGGKRPAVISRGYKGSARGLTVVSDGGGLRSTPDEAGDEPCLMADRLEGVPVVVCADRFRAGEYAIENLGADFIILDDGFQHTRLARDIDILLVDGAAGFGNGYLLPRGILREPVSSALRADAVFVKGRKGDAPVELKPLGLPTSAFDYKPTALVNLSTGAEAKPSALKGARVAAVSALADPRSFISTLEGLGAEVTASLDYPDHHVYSTADLDAIRSASGGADMVVTTEKDGVKLAKLLGGPGTLDIYALRIDVTTDKRALGRLFAPYFAGDASAPAAGTRKTGRKKPGPGKGGAKKDRPKKKGPEGARSAKGSAKKAAGGRRKKTAPAGKTAPKKATARKKSPARTSRKGKGGGGEGES